MKIHIIGGSGSGKTYFARRLSEKYGITCYDLDDIYWENDGGYNAKKSPDERERLLSEIMEKPDRITEGVYYKWCGKLFDSAEKIYLLDFPLGICKFRIIRRCIRRKLGIEKGKNESLKSLFALLKWTEKFQRVNIVEIRKIIEKYGEKSEIIKSKRQMNKILNT